MGKGKIMIFAPHPDDETLGCGGVLAKRIKEGYEPVIVLVTDGQHLFAYHGISDNPSPQQVARARLEETIKAIGDLGATKEQLVCLDYVNGKLDQHEGELAGTIAE